MFEVCIRLKVPAMGWLPPFSACAERRAGVAAHQPQEQRICWTRMARTVCASSKEIEACVLHALVQIVARPVSQAEASQ
jgi:hypothetical protein